MNSTGHAVVLGAGGWGTALSRCLALAGRRVTLWDRDYAFAGRLRETRENRMFLPGVEVPREIEIVSGTPPRGDVYVSAVPAQYIRGVMTTFLKGRLDPEIPFVSLSKGIEQETLLRPTEVLAQAAGAKRLAVLSGPSHAEEVGRGMPASVVLAAEGEKLAVDLRPIFHTEVLRVYTGGDPAGVEYAGALKCVLSIAAGICDGLGFGDNAKSALIARGIVEIARLGEALGARKQTFFGLSGIGDVVTSCVSPHGRNLAVGREIGKGRRLREVLDGMEMVAEGVWTSRAAQKLARRRKVVTPIIDEVCRVLFEDKPPLKAVRDLMTRDPKSEAEDLS